jgi:hypothetical protein
MLDFIKNLIVMLFEQLNAIAIWIIDEVSNAFLTVINGLIWAVAQLVNSFIALLPASYAAD